MISWIIICICITISIIIGIRPCSDGIALRESSVIGRVVPILVIHQPSLGVASLPCEREGVGDDTRRGCGLATGEPDTVSPWPREDGSRAVRIVLIRLHDLARNVRQSVYRVECVLVVEQSLVTGTSRCAAAAQVAIHHQGFINVGAEDVLLHESTGVIPLLDVLPAVVVKVSGAVQGTGDGHDLLNSSIARIVGVGSNDHAIGLAGDGAQSVEGIVAVEIRAIIGLIAVVVVEEGHGASGCRGSGSARWWTRTAATGR